MERRGREIGTGIAICRMEQGRAIIEDAGYYRFIEHEDDRSFMISIAPAMRAATATVVSGSLDMTVRELLTQLRATPGSALIHRLIGAREPG